MRKSHCKILQEKDRVGDKPKESTNKIQEVRVRAGQWLAGEEKENHVYERTRSFPFRKKCMGDKTPGRFG